jgi:hypothetical protein
VDRRSVVRLEGLGQYKHLLTSSGVETAIPRLAEYFNVVVHTKANGYNLFYNLHTTCQRRLGNSCHSYLHLPVLSFPFTRSYIYLRRVLLLHFFLSFEITHPIGIPFPLPSPLFYTVEHCQYLVSSFSLPFS